MNETETIYCIVEPRQVTWITLTFLKALEFLHVAKNSSPSVNRLHRFLFWKRIDSNGRTAASARDFCLWHSSCPYYGWNKLSREDAHIGVSRACDINEPLFDRCFKLFSGDRGVVQYRVCNQLKWATEVKSYMTTLKCSRTWKWNFKRGL